MVGLLLGACGGGGKATETGRAETRAEADLGAMPAQVNGHPVSLSEVSGLVRTGSLDPTQALDRLEARWLLYDEAERRNPQGLDPAASSALEQALVQALLRADVEATPITEAMVRAAYAKQSDRYSKKERRASVHILAKLPKGATADQREKAHAFARRALELLRGGPPKDFAKFKTKAQELGRGGPFEVVVERVPTVARVGTLDKAYEDALFAQQGPGLVPTPVESSFGVHAIYVTEVLPAESTPFDDVRTTLREELQLEHRRAALQQLLTTLRKEHPVVVHEDAAALLAEMTP